MYFINFEIFALHTFIKKNCLLVVCFLIKVYEELSTGFLSMQFTVITLISGVFKLSCFLR